MNDKNALKIKEETTPYHRDNYLKKSNTLILSKFKSSLFVKKLFTLCLMYIEESGDGQLFSAVTAAQIRKEFHKKNTSGSFYDQLKEASSFLSLRRIMIEGPNGFAYYTLMPSVEYIKGESLLMVKWNNDLRDYIFNLEENYTLLNKSYLLNLKSVYSFSLYEYLSSQAYVPKWAKEKVNVFEIKVTIPVLKIILEIIDLNDSKVQKVMLAEYKKNTPDLDKIINANTTGALKWSDLKKVLDMSVKEINDKTVLSVSYDTERSGVGGTTSSVIFHVQKNESRLLKEDVLKKEPSENMLQVLMTEIKSFIEEPLSEKDIASLLAAANYNIDRIRQAYSLMKESTSKIINVTGFLISAIKKDYQQAVEENSSKKYPVKAVNQFNNFPQRHYSEEEFADLEKKLLSR